MATVYATVTIGQNVYRLAAKTFSNDSGTFVSVWQVKGPQLGDWMLTRFEGNKLTSASLRKLFEGSNAPLNLWVFTNDVAA
jgi:hypothetical protein